MKSGRRRADAGARIVIPRAIQYTPQPDTFSCESMEYERRLHDWPELNRDIMPNVQLVYQDLGPDRILDAVESTGLHCNGHLHALNSYENRVYQIGVEEGGYIVAKFYRPGHWSDEAIREEHAFALELAGHEIPVVPPLRDARGETLHHHEGFRIAIYPRRGGRWLERGFVPRELQLPNRTLAEDVLKQVCACYQRAGDVKHIRLHGDCHPGNILWTDDGPHFVDFDDCRMGPAIQDLWMLLSGERSDMTAQLTEVLDGYSEFYDFHPRELNLVEALRTLRMLHYSAWLARRWEDPAFKQAFTWFNTQRYWEEQILALREQAALLDEPPLAWQ